MEKVKLTREQAEEIERYKKNGDEQIDYMIDGHIYDKRPDLKISTLKTSELARALYIGYEVEETFKVRDCVVLNDGKIVEIIAEESFTVVVAWIINGQMYRDQINKSLIKRHATKQEKWWAKHGRKPWKIREDDILVCPRGDVYTVQKILDGIVVFKEGGDKPKWEIKSGYRVACFAEDRKDYA